MALSCPHWTQPLVLERLTRMTGPRSRTVCTSCQAEKLQVVFQMRKVKRFDCFSFFIYTGIVHWNAHEIHSLSLENFKAFAFQRLCFTNDTASWCLWLKLSSNDPPFKFDIWTYSCQYHRRARDSKYLFKDSVTNFDVIFIFFLRSTINPSFYQSLVLFRNLGLTI